MVHDCTDSLTLLSHVNSSLEQTHRDNTAYFLGSQYYALRKNVPSESEFLFGDDLPKRIMNVTTNKLFGLPSKPYNTCFKISKIVLIPSNPWDLHSKWVSQESIWSIPETLHQLQQQQQAPKTKEKLIMLSPPGINNFIVNELH